MWFILVIWSCRGEVKPDTLFLLVMEGLLPKLGENFIVKSQREEMLSLWPLSETFRNGLFCYQEFFTFLKRINMQILCIFNSFIRTCGTSPLSHNISVVNTGIPTLREISQDYKWPPISSGLVLTSNEFVPNFQIKTSSFQGFLVFLLVVKELWISGTGKAGLQWMMLTLIS